MKTVLCRLTQGLRHSAPPLSAHRAYSMTALCKRRCIATEDKSWMTSRRCATKLLT